MLILCARPVLACAQVDGVLCTNGEGSFTSKSITGVVVTIGASKAHGLADRSCAAELRHSEKTINLVENAWQVDLDVIGVNFGLGGSAVGIQFKRRDVDRQMTYAIYSLTPPPRLLRTITGGDFFRAADFHFDGRIEIRTGDAAAVDGFDGVPLSSFDDVPVVYLRFDAGKLMDVSAEFKPEYDQTIANLKMNLDPADLRQFQSTNGKLDSIFLMPAEKIRSLVSTKIKVLEIVWCYLYSGREPEAWSALNEMWPSADVDRVRAAILEAQQHGIRKQVDGVSTHGPPLKIRRLRVYETGARFQQSGAAPGPWLPGGAERAFVADADPIPIYLRTGCTPANCAFQSNVDVLFKLRLDDAGKVRTATFLDSTLKGPAADMLLKSALEWKFVPAYKNGQPVACDTRQIIGPYR